MSDSPSPPPMDLKELRRLAAEANSVAGQPWERVQTGVYANDVPCAYAVFHEAAGKETIAGFIAAANPATILALLDRLEAAERERDAARGALRATGQVLAAERALLSLADVLAEKAGPFAEVYAAFADSDLGYDDKLNKLRHSANWPQFEALAAALYAYREGRG